MSRSAIRGSRIGAGPMGEDERGAPAPRTVAAFYCANGHVTELSFAAGVEIPESWDCARCGLPASQDRENPPAAVRIEPYKTHLAYAKERRTEDEAAAALTEALKALRARRKNGEQIF